MTARKRGRFVITGETLFCDDINCLWQWDMPDEVSLDQVERVARAHQHPRDMIGR